MKISFVSLIAFKHYYHELFHFIVINCYIILILNIFVLYLSLIYYYNK